MTKIQIILIVLSLLVGNLATIVFRSRLAYRLLAVFLFLTTTFFVLFPDATNVIAHYLGVTRGTDLLLYITLFAVMYAFLLLYAKVRKLERKITEGIRSRAISDAQQVR
jgi:small membrane protein